MIKFEVDTKEISWYTKQLEGMHQSAFPNAVRGTLNGLAFDVKGKRGVVGTMSQEADKAFVNRNKTFFTANSKVNQANGFNVNSMQSVVGMFPNANVKNNKAVEELEQQEHGGVIKDRELIPLNKARISGDHKRKVTSKSRLSQLKARQLKKSTKKSFVKDVYNAGKLGFIKTEKSILQITSIRKNKFKFKTLYKINKIGSVKIDKATHFMQKASEKSAKKANEIYIKEAQRQYERYYNS